MRAWRPAPHTWHQVWISASLSPCLADSMRLVFASCQPAATDSARAVRPASSRISRRRSASSCLARWTLDDGEIATATILCPGCARQSGGPVFGVRDRALPDSLERGGAQPHHGGIVRQLMLEEPAVASEITEADEPVIEHPEVVAGKAQIRRPAPREPAHLLAGRDVDGGRYLILEADEGSDRLRDHPGSPELDAPGSMSAYEHGPLRICLLRKRVSR